MILDAKSIKSRDVVPVYSSEETAKFWLFMVTNPRKTSTKMSGRYFCLDRKVVAGNIYRIDNTAVFNIDLKNVLRFDADIDEYFVFPKFNPLLEDYFVPKCVVKVCETEVDSLLN